MKNKALREQTFTQGAAVLLISTILVKLISAFFKIPLSQDYCLGDLGFGYFSFSYDIYIPIYTLASSGFPVAISKIMSDYSAEGRYNEADRAFRLYRNIMLILGLGGFISLLLLSKLGIFSSAGNENTSYTMYAMAPAVIFCCLSSVYRGAFESKRNMTPTAVSNIIEALAKVVLGFGSAFVTVRLTHNLLYGAAAAMCGISLGTAVSFLYLKFSYSINYKSRCEKKNGGNKGLLKNLIIISLPIVFSSLSVSIISLIDALTVNFRLSEMMDLHFAKISQSFDFSADLTSETLPTFLYGIRSKAYTLFHLVPTFASSLAVSSLPTLTADFSSDKLDGVKRNSASLIKFCSLITFPLGFGMIFVGKPVMSLLYGEATAVSGGIMLSIYGFAAIGVGLSIAFTTILQSMGKQNIAFLNFAVGLLLKLVFNIVLVSIPFLNIYGSAISTVICYCFVLIVDFIILFKSGLIPDIKNTIVKPMISAVFCGSIAFVITLISSSKLITLLAVLLSAVVYILALLLLKTFIASDFSGLPFQEKLLKFLKIK